MSKTITLTFTPADMQVLSEALINLPFKQVASIINNINVQVQMQEKAAKSVDIETVE